MNSISLLALTLFSLFAGSGDDGRQADTTSRLYDCAYVGWAPPASFPPADDVEYFPELMVYCDCAALDEHGDIVLREEHLRNIIFPDDGPAPVVILHPEVSAVYVNKTGITARTLLVDNGADYFAEGLARTLRSGKIGYINRSLKLVIPAEYDFGFPFREGLAKVCLGCRSISDGVHARVSGGRWGYIDTNGQEVVPIVYGQTDLPVKADRK